MTADYFPVDVGEREEAAESVYAPPEPEKEPEPPPPPTHEANGGGAMVVRARTYEMELQPRSIEAAWKFSKAIYQSRLYGKYPNAESIFAIIVRGREMGLSALTSLDCFHVIQGKPVMSAWLIIARAKEHPDCEYFQCIETTDQQSTWETKNRRNPVPTRLTYSMEMARVAGLIKGNGGWTNNPADMVRKTAGVKLARMEYPSAALGLYAPEEFGYEEE